MDDGRPSKRVKHNHDSKHRPSTIAQRLSQSSYTDLAPLLEDISAVASAIAHSVRLEAEKKEEPPSNAPTPRDGSQDELPLVLAKVLIFQQTAHNLAMVEQSRRSGVFELEIPPAPQLALTQKVCLTVMSQNGPLFSSLQKPTTIAASTSPSTASTPAPSPSTAPTSLQSSPLKSKVAISEVAVVQPIPESTLPVSISTTKAHSSKSAATKNSVPVKTIGETFPAPAYLRPIGPPPKGGTQYKGLTWGGGRTGGPPPEMVHETQTRTGTWLSYKNDTPDPRGKGGVGSLMGANALPAEFVAAYTSFAPTRDDSFASVPSSVKQMVWWAKVGKEKFSRLLPEFEKLGLFNRIEEVSEEDTGDAMDVDDKEEMVNEEEEFLKAVEAFQPAEVPIDFRLLNGDWQNEPDTTSDTASFNSDVEQKLERISSLLESLHKQQHIRLAAPPPPPPPTKASKSPPVASPTATPVVGTPNQPNELEIMLYNDTVKELTKLISQLPPHLVANIHGDPDGELALSSMVPLTNGKVVWKGTLPSVGARSAMNGYPSQSPLLSHPTQQAMPAAAGMPMNGGAPQAPMMNVRMQQQPSQQYHLPPQHQTPARAPVNVPAPPPPQQYHTARMPQQGMAGGYGHPQQVMTPQPQQAQYQNYHRHAAPVPNQAPMQQPQVHYPTPYIATATPMQQGGSVPTTPQPGARVISPMTPAAMPHQPYQQVPTPQPQPQLYHSHSYPAQHHQQPVQTPQRTAQAPQGTPHYMQGIQPPPPRVIGPVNAPAHHQQLQPQPQVYHQHHIPATPVQQPQVPQQPVYHQHTIPQPQATSQSQYHHHHHVIRNPYPQQAVPQQPPPQQQGMSPMMGYQQIQAQPQQIQYQQQPHQVQYAPRMNVPPPQGLGAVGYGPPVPQMQQVQQVPVPQMQGMPGTPTPVRYASRK